MSKQTAVEWLIDRIVQDQLYRDISYKVWLELFEQAKAIEKEQEQLYATFCLRCINEKLPVIRFEDWIKTNNKTI
jgi:hypothetical protein